MLGLLGLLVITSVLLLWRLSASPIQLNKLTPSIQRVVSGLPGNFAIRIEGIELIWDKQENTLQMRATQVGLIANNGVRIVEAPVVNISISISALMSRVIALSAIEIKGVSIHLVRNKDGSLQLGKKVSDDATETSKPGKTRGFHDLTEVLANTFALLESPPDPQHPLSYLKTIDLKGDLTAEDHKLDMEFQFKDIDFAFKGQTKGITGDLSLSIDGPAALKGIGLDISLTAKGKDITADVNVSDVLLSNLSGLAAGLEPLGGVDLVLKGTLSGNMTLPDTVHSLDLDIGSDAGTITLERFIPKPLDIRTLRLKAKADPASGHLELSQLSLSLGDSKSGGPDLQLKGVVKKLDSLLNVTAQTSLKKLAIDELADYWPAELVPGTRDWLTQNLKAGTVDEVSLDINIDLPSGKDGTLELKKLDGTIAYSDLSVFYFRPMPAATGITGSGSFNQQGFDLSVKTGLIKGIAIKTGRVQVTGLDVNEVALDVKTSLDGKISDALAILESPPIGLDKVIGFGSTQAGGHLSAEFGISLPLKSGLLPGEIDYHVAASLEQASVQNIYKNISLENGTLEIDDDFKHLGIKGTLDLAGIPITLDWDSERDESGKLATNINAKTTEVKATDINRLGYPVDRYFSGSFAAELDVKIGTGGVVDISVSTDLDKSDLSITPVHWNKPAGVEGTASAGINISKTKQWDIRDFKIEAGTLSAKGEADYDPLSSMLTIDLDSVSLGQTSLMGLDVTFKPEQATQISLKGGKLDLAPVLVADSGQDKKASTGEASTGSTATPMALRLDVTNLDKVLFSQDRFLTDVSAVLEHGNDGWQSIQISGHNPLTVEDNKLNLSKKNTTQLKPGEFSFDFGPLLNGNYPLSIKVQDLGSFLVTTFDNHMLTGGELVIEGESSATLFHAPLNTTVKLDEFRIVDAPIAAQVLSFASLRQALDTLKSEGLIINSFYGDLSLAGNTLSSKLLRAHGGTVGATIKGEITLDPPSLDLSGSVIPLDKISNLLGKVPVLKDVLVADKGQGGIIAVDYAVKGSFDKPDVSVNPGSLLTPGALRDIFDFNKEEQ